MHQNGGGEPPKFQLPKVNRVVYTPRPVRKDAPMAAGVVGGSGWVLGIGLLVVILAVSGVLKQDPKENDGTSIDSSSSDGKLLLETARQYDDDRYVWGGGHPPSEYDFGEGLDCSGLINVAVLEAFGINDWQRAETFRNSEYWEPIDIEDAREGDIVYILKEGRPERRTDHVAIVVSNGGDGQLTIFHAATSEGPVDNQIRENSGRSYSDYDGALRFNR